MTDVNTDVNFDGVNGIESAGQIVGTISTASQHNADGGPSMDFAEVSLRQTGKASGLQHDFN